jgi:putative hydrolase of the HAD superfamily
MFGGSIGFPAYAHELLWDDKSPLGNLAPHLPDYRVAVWYAACDSLGLGGQIEAKETSRRLVTEIAALRVPYPESDAVLRDLAMRFRMAILTNGEPEVQAMKVERSGLSAYFDHVVLCAEHGSKPNPQPFEVALKLLGCEPHEVAMIGNGLRSDIGGAQALGIYSVWINRTGKPNESGIIPDAEIQDLAQLNRLVSPLR